ncbi:2-aminoethylphosphonate--pyruvate transaminase [Enterococcus mundtii]|uniref:2-aminoethylphosphonate--pyruvate transaminase n=1 Tax=Enterococcus mundtii TaxID=53346 RepID=UPI000DF989EB|nr:2-aminoethylphosphonate--pyruvate transaminase [Enterococcus mundtii]STD25109.1 2-aminoethylphosphonate--pyruvate transaminase [Enterococcus mundtii]
MSGKTKVIEQYEKEINHSKINYKLLTPGPLTTSRTVKEAMLVDHCTWDDDFKVITQAIRQRLLDLASVSNEAYTAVLMQGSGSFAVESVLSSVVGSTDRLLICTNGAYGQRMVQMAEYHGIDHVIYQVAENEIPQAEKIEELLVLHPDITALAMIHSETTSGILNPLEAISAVTKKHKLCFIVDAMSSFGGIPIPVGELGIDFLVSSANKCIQGVPGFGFVICQKELLKKSAGQARTLSMDLYDQFRVMDIDGKWRFTSPTHTVLAFWQALEELADEGGIDARYDRYQLNNERLRERMAEIGFEAYVSENQGPFITSFKYPESIQFEFQAFYDYLKAHGYAIYPGKISDTDCFRIGNIGEIYLEDIEKVAGLIQQYMEEQKYD